MKPIAIFGAIVLMAIVSTHSHLAKRNANVGKAPAPITTVAASQTQIDSRVSLEQSDDAPSDIKVVLLALRPEGFEPQELRLPVDEYLFVIRNRSGLEGVNIRLRRETGEQLIHSPSLASRRDWKERIKLTPGSYLLTENDHSDWTCRVVVER